MFDCFHQMRHADRQKLNGRFPFRDRYISMPNWGIPFSYSYPSYAALYRRRSVFPGHQSSFMLFQGLLSIKKTNRRY
jgi:hypothetical protein